MMSVECFQTTRTMLPPQGAPIFPAKLLRRGGKATLYTNLIELELLHETLSRFSASLIGIQGQQE